MDNTEATLARHDERISDLEQWRDRQHKTLDGIQQDLKELRQEYDRRPTWSVTIIISILGTATGSMAVFIVTNL